jgi:pimeloyl-ACP methyl ester carboxylesterase
MEMKKMNLLLIPALIFAACGGGQGDLSRGQADRLAQKAWQEKLTRIEAEYGPMIEAQKLELRNLRMPLFTAIYGDPPGDGRSLWISMHGGGATTPDVNDEQWENQKTLYSPAEGVYIAPRAPVDDWNMWFRPAIDTLFGMIIQTSVARYGVNPNKVYVMGYSAGGDGAYRLAPRTADRWAAAAMMAGHPGDTSPLNLRDIPFTLWMGALDSAFHRNTLAVQYSARLDSLETADPPGYIHQTNMVSGAGHWMNNADTAAIKWMARFRRNPYPETIVWRQEASAPRSHFYWLSVPASEALPGRQVRVVRNGNTIDIVRNDYPTLYILLNDRMVDLDRPITVTSGGQTLFNEKTPRRAEFILGSVEDRVDPDYIFTARLEADAAGVRSSPVPTSR